MLRAGAQGHHVPTRRRRAPADDQEQEDRALAVSSWDRVVVTPSTRPRPNAGRPQGRRVDARLPIRNRDGRGDRVLQGRDGAISASRRVVVASLP